MQTICWVEIRLTLYPERFYLPERKDAAEIKMEPYILKSYFIAVA